MDIWQWVYKKENALREQGETRLAEIIENIPSYVVDDRHDKLDMVFAEGLQHARRLGDTWVELFLRHWNLQSHVVNRHKVSDMMGEAVDLLEFSHREENQGCPQRICTVQDLAIAYGIKDGPGFTEERLEVCTEALAAIDPSWPCYDCIAAEYLSALIDAERHDELEAGLRHFQSERKKHGQGEPDTALAVTYAEALLLLGEIDQAREMITQAQNSGGGEGFEKKKRLLLCRIDALSGNFERAEQHCMAFEEIVTDHCYYLFWANIKYELARKHQIPIDQTLLIQLHTLTENFEQHGATRKAIRVVAMLADLALQSDHLFNAQVAAKRYEKLIPLLHRELGAGKELARIKERIETKSKAHSPVKDYGEQEIIEQEFDNMESAATAYAHAFERYPGNFQIALKYAQCLEYFYQRDEGLDIVRTLFLQNEGSDEIRYQYGRYLLNNFSGTRFLEEFSHIDKASLSQEGLLDYLWLHSFASQVKDKEKSLDYITEFLNIAPDNVAALKRAARLCQNLGRYESTLYYLEKCLELEQEDNLENLYWDMLVPATLLQRWDIVRAMCEHLNISLDSQSGPIAENMGSILICFDDLAEGENMFIATRTGPVSARIHGVTRLEYEQRYGWELIFDPSPLNRLDQKDEEGYAHDNEGRYYLMFSPVEVVNKPVYFTFAIDGVHPGETAIAKLIEELSKLGCAFSQRNGDDYMIEFDQTDGESLHLPGIYALVLVPQTQDKKQIHELLIRSNEALEHPLIWPMLAENLGDVDELTRQQQIEERYNLY